MAADEGRIRRVSIALHDESTVASMIAHERIFVVAEVRIVAVLNPLLLHEFKLPRDARIQRHEDDTAILGIRDGISVGREASIGQAAPGNAATVDEPAIEAEGIAGVNATDVRSDWAARAFRIRAVSEVGAAVRKGRWRVDSVNIGRHDELCEGPIRAGGAAVEERLECCCT